MHTLVDHHSPAGGAIEERRVSCVTKRIASLACVLRWRYSALYPPPFRLGLHTGGGWAVGRTLNKWSNTLQMASCRLFTFPSADALRVSLLFCLQKSVIETPLIIYCMFVDPFPGVIVGQTQRASFITLLMGRLLSCTGARLVD